MTVGTLTINYEFQVAKKRKWRKERRGNSCVRKAKIRYPSRQPLTSHWWKTGSVPLCQGRLEESFLLGAMPGFIELVWLVKEEEKNGVLFPNLFVTTSATICSYDDEATGHREVKRLHPCLKACARARTLCNIMCALLFSTELCVELYVWGWGGEGVGSSEVLKILL